MSRFRHLFHLGKVEDVVDWEIRHHIEERADELMAAQGLSREEAQREARRPGRRVRVAVNLNGQHDLTLPVAQDFLTNVMGHPAPWSEAELRDISTVTFARPDVSVLTIHGAGDDDVDVAQGDRLTAALRAKGADTEFIRLEGQEGNCHTDCWKVPRAREALHRFLARKLGT